MIIMYVLSLEHQQHQQEERQLYLCLDLVHYGVWNSFFLFSFFSLVVCSVVAVMHNIFNLEEE